MNSKWQKSSYSANSCIEVQGDEYWVNIRETDDPKLVITTSRANWDAFVKGVKAGEFD